MEGETNETIEVHRKLFHARALPDLDDNIKIGNSLIDIDYYENELDFGEERKIKPFSWQKNFPEVFKQGGFDCVIGNPPYVMLQNIEIRRIFDYALKKFASAKYKIDTYQLFIEQAVKLLKNGGMLGFITPNTFLKNIHAEPLRKFILDQCAIKEFLLFNYSVFHAASVDTCISIFEKSKGSKKSNLTINKSESVFEVKKIATINQRSFAKNNRTNFNLAIGTKDTKILNKIANRSKPLGTFCGAYFGIQTFDRTEYVSNTKKSKKYEPVIDGENIEPYKLKPSTEYVHYISSAIKSGGNEVIYRQDRICIRQIGATPIATFVPANIFTLNTIYNVYLKDKNLADLRFLLGIINSKATKYFWKKNNSDEKKIFPKIKKEAILSIPIPNADAKTHTEIIKHVDRLLQLYQDIQAATLPSQKERIQSRIDYSEDRINAIVYELYGLTDTEIAIIEGEST